MCHCFCCCCYCFDGIYMAALPIWAQYIVITQLLLISDEKPECNPMTQSIQGIRIYTRTSFYKHPPKLQFNSTELWNWYAKKKLGEYMNIVIVTIQSIIALNIVFYTYNWFSLLYVCILCNIHYWILHWVMRTKSFFLSNDPFSTYNNEMCNFMFIPTAFHVRFSITQ